MVQVKIKGNQVEMNLVEGCVEKTVKVIHDDLEFALDIAMFEMGLMEDEFDNEDYGWPLEQVDEMLEDLEELEKVELEPIEIYSLERANEIGYHYIVRTCDDYVMLLNDMVYEDEDTWAFSGCESYTVLMPNRFQAIEIGKAYRIIDLI